MNYSVIIVTFHKRFDEWFKPLLEEIRKQRPDLEVIVCVNGELSYFPETYRKKVLKFLSGFNNVFPLLFPRFRGVARMWNLGIQFATHERVLVLSDDITLVEGFFDQYESVQKTTFSINESFSAFSVSKNDMLEVGWFDERFLGMGWEDGDFIERYRITRGVKDFPSEPMQTCKNVADKVYYWVHNQKLEDLIKNEARLEGQQLDSKHGRYSEFNKQVFEARYAPSVQYPYEGFYLTNKQKL